MRMPSGLKKLDDKVLGTKGSDRADAGRPREVDLRDESRPDEQAAERPKESTTRTAEPAAATGRGDGLSSLLAVFWRVSKLVLLALGLVVLLAAALILLPANEDNVIVRNLLSLAETVAGPFKDVFSVDDPDRMRVYNYALAALVYFIVAGVVGRLPTGSTRKS